MSTIVTVVVLTASLSSAAVGAGRRMLERRRARRQLRERPMLLPQTSEGTVVRVTGVVRALERTLIAPLSGATCVMVRSRVTVRGSVVQPLESFAMTPFVIERDEGAVSIEGEHALLDLDPLPRVSKRAKTPEDHRRRQAFMLLHGYSHRRAAKAHFDETVLQPGMTVTVAGLMMKDVSDEPMAAGEQGFRDAGPVALRLAGDAGHPLVIGVPDKI